MDYKEIKDLPDAAAISPQFVEELLCLMAKHRIGGKKPEPERVEWPKPEMVTGKSPGGRACYDESYSVYVVCPNVTSANKTSPAIRAVLQALREGYAIIGMKDPDPNFHDILVQPDGSRP